MKNLTKKAKRKNKKGSVAAYVIIAIAAIIALLAGLFLALSDEGYFRATGANQNKTEQRGKNAGGNLKNPADSSGDKENDNPGSPGQNGIETGNDGSPENYPEDDAEPTTPDHGKNIDRTGNIRPGVTGEITGKAAIIIDDFGNSMNNVDEFCSLEIPVTFAILPDLPYSGKISWKARQSGKEIILHLPLENHTGVNPGPGTITTEMTGEEVIKEFKKNLESVPGAVGFNNHEGSKATEDEELMETIMKLAGEKGLFFIDSRTSSGTVGRITASRFGVPVADRRVFLDNEDDVDYIKGQLKELAEKAVEDGEAVGIGHCRKSTLTAIEDMIPEFQKQGIEFVFASEIVK